MSLKLQLPIFYYGIQNFLFGMLLSSLLKTNLVKTTHIRVYVSNSYDKGTISIKHTICTFVLTSCLHPLSPQGHLYFKSLTPMMKIYKIGPVGINLNMNVKLYSEFCIYTFLLSSYKGSIMSNKTLGFEKTLLLDKDNKNNTE